MITYRFKPVVMKYGLVLFFSLLLSSTFAQRTCLHCGKLIDIKDGKVRSQVTVIMEGKLIVDVGNGYVNGRKRDLALNLKNKTAGCAYRNLPAVYNL